MRTIRKTGVTALTAGIALALGVVPVALTVPSILASSESVTTLTPSAVGEVSAGEVVLSTTTDKGIIKYGGLEQTFTGGQQCEVTPESGSDPLLKITGSIGEGQPGRAGFDKGNIGVFETSDGSSGPINASQCSRVDAGSFTTTESLNILLDTAGPYSDAPFSDRLLVGSATVDAKVANTRNGTITIGFLDADGKLIKDSDEKPITKPAPWSNKKTGFTIVIPDLSAALIPELALAGGFSGIRLTATDGAFTLQGATFNLVSQADKEFCTGDFVRENAAVDAKVTYLGPVSGTTDCFRVRLDATVPREVEFIYPLGSAPEDAQFLYEVTWKIVNDNGTPAVNLPATKIDFEAPGSTVGFLDLPFCPDNFYDGAGTLVGVPDAAALAGLPDWEELLVGKQYACVGERTADIGEDEIVITERNIVVGDARMRL